MKVICFVCGEILEQKEGEASGLSVCDFCWKLIGILEDAQKNKNFKKVEAVSKMLNSRAKKNACFANF